MPTGTVNQPSINPTNKLTAATVGAAVISVGGLVLKNLAPEWYDPEVMLSITPVVIFVFGWLIRDKPNVTIDTTAGDK